MRRDSSVMWIYALAATLLATVAVARCAPDPERMDTAVLDASRPIADPIPDEGWWKNRAQ
ncbi:MAG TPA: hypothetical protein VL966_14405 [Alphaproteobacteria bacterium]|jgi:hypothetical protein|nr:hypothetical protein [Alphaproteobacteria bacterium]